MPILQDGNHYILMGVDYFSQFMFVKAVNIADME